MNPSEHEVKNSVKYIHKMDHRDGTGNKSQWSISQQQERNCFLRMHDSAWFLVNKGWGLHLVKKKPEYLGYRANSVQLLFIAKFVDGNNNSIWHGYPADHIRFPDRDIPIEYILLDWRNLGYLSNAKMRKIMKGQRCNL
jgi:hypothetical protein